MSMNKLRGLHHISAQAVVPEQLLAYVAAVGGSRPQLFGDCVGHVHEDSVVLVGYPLHSTAPNCSAAAEPDYAELSAAVDTAVLHVLKNAAFSRITVLGPVRPSAAPADSSSLYDTYWSLLLPPLPPRQKLRNMLRRAHRDVYIEMAPCWTEKHDALVALYCRSRPLEAGTRHIFQHLGDYVHGPDGLGTAHLGEVQVFSAYSRKDDSLLACALADYSSLRTAFYMFAFRHPTAPPGSSDLLLDALCSEGLTRGHSMVNLGLGINPGISFFKKKWQAEAFLPYVETSWEVRPARNSWWSRLFS